MTLVTPAEAAEKLCPQMLPFIGTQDPAPVDAYCRGPRCMAWRWGPAAPQRKPTLRRGGYCGLAGDTPALAGAGEPPR